MIGVTPGYALANVDTSTSMVRGVGGHGAYPQTTKDPIVLASRIVMTLQTLVSRENNPLDPAVVTVGSFHAGTKHNVIPDDARLQLTVRSYKPEVRKQLLDGIARIARGEAIAAGMPDDRMPVVTVREQPYTPSTYNTEKLAGRLIDLFGAHFGADRVVERPSRSWAARTSAGTGSPTSRVEATIFWVGGVPKAKWDAVGGDTPSCPRSTARSGRPMRKR